MSSGCRRRGWTLGLWLGLGVGLVPMVSWAQPQPGDAQPAKSLSLREAMELGLGRDPGVVSAKQTRDRSQLAVTRAQLDRFSLRVDAFVNEQYRASNLGGSPPSPSCATLAPVRGGLYAPFQLYSMGGGGLSVPTESECAAASGQYLVGDTIQTGGLGQFSLAANLNVPIFTGFRVSATVERAQHLRDSAEASLRQSERQIALDVLRAFWAARRLELQLDVSRQSLERFNEAAAAIAARVKNGLAPVIDQNRMESRRQSEVSRRADLEGGLLEAKAQLGVLLGMTLFDTALAESTVRCGTGLPPRSRVTTCSSGSCARSAVMASRTSWLETEASPSALLVRTRTVDMGELSCSWQRRHA